MGPLGLLGLLDRTGITDRAGLTIPESLKNAVALATNPQAFLTGQVKQAAAEANPQIAAGLATLDVPQAFESDLKRAVINGAVADSPTLQNFVPQQDYQTVDLIKTIQNGINTPNGVNTPMPTWDNIDIGQGWSPAGYTPDFSVNAFMPGANVAMPEYTPDFQYEMPSMDAYEWYSRGGKV